MREDQAQRYIVELDDGDGLWFPIHCIGDHPHGLTQEQAKVRAHGYAEGQATARIAPVIGFRRDSGGRTIEPISGNDVV